MHYRYVNLNLVKRKTWRFLYYPSFHVDKQQFIQNTIKLRFHQKESNQATRTIQKHLKTKIPSKKNHQSNIWSASHMKKETPKQHTTPKKSSSNQLPAQKTKKKKKKPGLHGYIICRIIQYNWSINHNICWAHLLIKIQFIYQMWSLKPKQKIHILMEHDF